MRELTRQAGRFDTHNKLDIPGRRRKWQEILDIQPSNALAALRVSELRGLEEKANQEGLALHLGYAWVQVQEEHLKEEEPEIRVRVVCGDGQPVESTDAEKSEDYEGWWIARFGSDRLLWQRGEPITVSVWEYNSWEKVYVLRGSYDPYFQVVHKGDWAIANLSAETADKDGIGKVSIKADLLDPQR